MIVAALLDRTVAVDILVVLLGMILALHSLLAQPDVRLVHTFAVESTRNRPEERIRVLIPDTTLAFLDLHSCSLADRPALAYSWIAACSSSVDSLVVPVHKLLFAVELVDSWPVAYSFSAVAGNLHSVCSLSLVYHILPVTGS